MKYKVKVWLVVEVPEGVEYIEDDVAAHVEVALAESTVRSDNYVVEAEVDWDSVEEVED